MKSDEVVTSNLKDLKGKMKEVGQLRSATEVLETKLEEEKHSSATKFYEIAQLFESFQKDVRGQDDNVNI